MGFNNGFEHVRLENKWKKLRIQYREAGMSEEAIQEMYNFDVQVVNSEQRYYRHSKDLAFNDADTEDTHSNDRYEEAILMADTYRETKSRFTWQPNAFLERATIEDTTVTYALVNPKTKRFTSQTAKKTEYRKATHYDNDSYILEKAYYCFEHNLPSYKENA